MINNKKGFSLMEVVIVAGLLGVLSLGFMQLMKNISKTQSFAQSKSDELELRSTIRMILSDEKNCRVSIAGNGPSGAPITPVTFYKEDIDEDSEGIDISLHLSNQAGDTRSLKKLNGANNPEGNDKSKFGKLKIKTMKLIMNNGVGFNYSDSLIHNDIGIIKVVFEKKVSKTQMRNITMDFDVNIGMSTGQPPEATEETRILNCGNAIAPSCIVRSADTSVWTFLSNVGGSAKLYNTTVTVNCLAGEKMKLCSDDLLVTYNHDNSKVAPATWLYTNSSCAGNVGMIEGSAALPVGTYKVRGLCCNF